MKIKQLESLLEQVEDFERPKIVLEQYSTPSYVAATMIHTAAMDGYIEGQQIIDLGCGPGMLSIACSLMDADWIIGLEIDGDAIQRALENTNDDDLVNIELVQGDALDSPFHNNVCDTVVMNPPFGTKGNKGIDVSFLKVATKLARKSVYSLHKSSTRNFMVKKGNELGLDPQVLGQFSYELPATYAKHTKDFKTIDVDLIRFTHKS